MPDFSIIQRHRAQIATVIAETPKAREWKHNNIKNRKDGMTDITTSWTVPLDVVEELVLTLQAADMAVDIL